MSVPNRNSFSRRTPVAAKSTCSMIWCSVICVKKPAALVNAGAKSPANAAAGFSGVAKLENTRLYQTTSGFSCRMVFSRRTGVARLPNLQQRITLNPATPTFDQPFENCHPVGCEFIIRQLVGQDRQLDVGAALQLPRDMKGILVQLAPTWRKRGN
jgi:hypothetical protein